MTDYQHQINVSIAQTLEKLQDLNPDLYGIWYSKLYNNPNEQTWNVKTLHVLEQFLIDYIK